MRLLLLDQASVFKLIENWRTLRQVTQYNENKHYHKTTSRSDQGLA